MRKHPRYVREGACVACGICEPACPERVITFAPAVPLGDVLGLAWKPG